LSAGIVKQRTAGMTIPEQDSCGETVEGAVIPLRAEENHSMKYGAGGKG
jgi:hypothetical protein